MQILRINSLKDNNLKNTYGEDDIRVGMAFHGATGIFCELPKGRDMENFNYDSVLDGQYFLDEYNKLNK